MKRSHASTVASFGAVILLTALPDTGWSAPSFRLRRMVVVGDSLLAGFSSGGLVANGRAGQVDSAPAIIARRAHASLPQPLMDGPGVPPQLAIFDDNHNDALDPGEVRRPDGTSIGFRASPDRRVRNLAVPGEDTATIFDTVSPGDVAGAIVRNDDVAGQDLLKFLILGLPLRTGPVSQLSRARDLHPSFLLVWIGNNDVLDMATRTDPAAVTLTPAQFGARFHMLLDALAVTNAPMAVANLPDVTGIAALRRAAGEVTACQGPGGALQPVAADDLLSLDLDRSLLPNPPCGKVLDAGERAAVRATVVAFNAEIATAIADISARRGIDIALVDLQAGFDQLAATGVDLDGNGTPDLTTHYLGGIFSLDGIHPTHTGNALIANIFIDAINAHFGESLARVDVARIAARDPLTRSRFRPTGEAPFGLFGDSDNDEVETFFVGTFNRVEQGVRSVRNDLRRNFFDLF